MDCYKYLISGFVSVAVGILLVIASDKSRSESRPAGNVKIKISGGTLLMLGILVIIGSLIGIPFGCLPQTITGYLSNPSIFYIQN
jgi:hypothetical protein